MSLIRVSCGDRLSFEENQSLADEGYAGPRGTSCDVLRHQSDGDQLARGCHVHADDRGTQIRCVAHRVEQCPVRGRTPDAADVRPFRGSELRLTDLNSWVGAQARVSDDKRNGESDGAAGARPVEERGAPPTQRCPARHRTVCADALSLFQNPLLDDVRGDVGPNVEPGRRLPKPRTRRLALGRAFLDSRIDRCGAYQGRRTEALRVPPVVVHPATLATSSLSRRSELRAWGNPDGCRACGREPVG
jgi:endogenous inhibitor of DNA gyrase (YacG/DUF329 family)